MSHSVVKDIPPATDKTLVIVVGQDGSLSVDQEILDNLMSKWDIITINNQPGIYRMCFLYRLGF